jgi:hypothetical protein
MHAEAFDERPAPTISDVFALLERPAWHAKAACRGQLDVMFPKSRNNGKAWSAALGVCATCTVVDECRQAAERHHEAHGVWGGVRRNADSSRFSLLDLLAELGGWITARELADITGWSPQRARRRLVVCWQAGHLDVRYEGRTAAYRPTGAK